MPPKKEPKEKQIKGDEGPSKLTGEEGTLKAC
jgi:hypothetical protein